MFSGLWYIKTLGSTCIISYIKYYSTKVLSVLHTCVDVESVMNSVVSLLLILEPDKQEALIESLCEKLVKFREGERPSLRLQL